MFPIPLTLNRNSLSYSAIRESSPTDEL
jgi:hypothetical protein